ncbi:Multicopper oxidase, type 1 [Kalmanozyma brasiliensis GHG001]|uniref:laccase n=1 Tax=Kalmanozyma brasiliensis (strain GHG001) TaxID=1365824 RepID=V5ESY4_KALBG|nr:Multicopper oxidase, type 1 [Kalmanozyma brasiliensis GHG001]EST08350.1 Multicopper oxidase, type 1 [Kalmanozyma brasiliensis GHG001]
MHLHRVHLWLAALLPLLSLLLTTVSALPNTLSARTPAPSRPAPRRRVTVRHYTLTITSTTLWQQCDPFGPTTVINSTFPGPQLRARVGEILQVRVINNLPTSAYDGGNLTMHFHGLAMHMHPVMDGTTMISQWPITPGNFFDYRIPLTAEDKGTYFYHSHVGVQAMSAYGALVVEDPEDRDVWDPSQATSMSQNDPKSVEYIHVDGTAGLAREAKSGRSSPYKWDADRVLAVGDWFSYSSTSLVQKQLGGDPFVWPGSASKLLLNGKSTPPASPAGCNQTKATITGVACTAAPPNCAATAQEYPTIQMDYEKTYRLRSIGATALMYVSLGILTPTTTPYASANATSTTPSSAVSLEKLSLIEADGSYLDALDVDRFELAAGQRYSVLFRSRSRKQVERDNVGGVYWMRAESRWRAGPSMWIKIVYPSATPSTISAATPPVKLFDGQKDLSLLPAETFGWVGSAMAPLSKRGGPEWWYASPMPRDDQVTRTVVIDTQQVRFLPSTKGIKWDQNGQPFNENQPSEVPYLVKTFLGDIAFPNASQFASAMYNQANYTYNPSTTAPRVAGAGPSVDLISSAAGEADAANTRHWAQGYSGELNMYFARAGEVIDIVLVNKPSLLSSSVEIHPWHMHSHKHFTRTVQPGTFSFSRLSSLYSSGNGGYERPIQRDTSVAYASPGAAYLNQTLPNPAEDDGGFTVLRYKVDAKNAGVFLLHCHITFHLEMGMATVWTIAPDELADRNGIYWPKNGSVEGLSNGWSQFGSSVNAVL